MVNVIRLSQSCRIDEKGSKTKFYFPTSFSPISVYTAYFSLKWPPNLLCLLVRQNSFNFLNGRIIKQCMIMDECNSPTTRTNAWGNCKVLGPHSLSLRMKYTHTHTQNVIQYHHVFFPLPTLDLLRRSSPPRLVHISVQDCSQVAAVTLSSQTNFLRTKILSFLF